MKLFDTIVNAMADYDVSLEVKEHELLIVNRQNGNRLYVYEEAYASQDMTDRFVEYIAEFSTQHRHFEADEEDEILEYIQSIMNDKILPLEFYLDGKRRFGGEIAADDIEELSVPFLARQYGFAGDCLTSLDYEIHSWSGKYDTGLRRVAELSL